MWLGAGEEPHLLGRSHVGRLAGTAGIYQDWEIPKLGPGRFEAKIQKPRLLLVQVLTGHREGDVRTLSAPRSDAVFCDNGLEVGRSACEDHAQISPAGNDNAMLALSFDSVLVSLQFDDLCQLALAMEPHSDEEAVVRSVLWDECGDHQALCGGRDAAFLANLHGRDRERDKWWHGGLRRRRMAFATRRLGSNGGITRRRNGLRLPVRQARLRPVPRMMRL
mmetsp:Transcript_8488/g.26983  ORF Transcript_8488/g.26983 Transcript_8488/m.26983 type:complete len:221 (+) Transcript_8488:915-1577(+)